ncbi:MAG: flagellar basal body rod C-terminal domain-containing protein [bacterium]
MNDPFITSINSQKITMDWISLLVTNMTNIHTPGYRELEGNFKTFLDGVDLDDLKVKIEQGKARPGTSPDNVFLEGKGFFVAKTPEDKIFYTRLGEFAFDGEGKYKTKEGYAVQGYILDDNGEIMSNVISQRSDLHAAANSEGGPSMPATTDIRMWIDPGNGKYLGKYDEYEIKEDGILYGKSDKGKTLVPLYKIAIMNFHNSGDLTQIKKGYFVENEESGKPVLGKGEVRSGLIESSNCDLVKNTTNFQEAKMQLEMVNKLISTNKQLLEEALKLLQ